MEGLKLVLTKSKVVKPVVKSKKGGHADYDPSEIKFALHEGIEPDAAFLGDLRDRID